MDNKKLLEQFLGENNPTLKQVTSFATIRAFGDKNTATTHDGIKVHRLDSIYFEGFGLVTCAQYSAHFVYEHKSGIVGRWSTMCTCGSPAVIVSYNSPINKLMSKPTDGGFILVCMAHTSTKDNVGVGKHADGVHE